MHATGIGMTWLLFVLGLGGGAGLPLGLPPLPEDPALANVAPEECLGYIASAGIAAADPNNANETERLLAEPEVRNMAALLEQAIRTSMGRMKKHDLPPGMSSDDAADLVKLLLTRPLALYVQNVQIDRRGPQDIHAGLIVSLGEDGPKVKAKLDAMVKEFVKDAPEELVKEVTIDGQKWNQFGFATWGLHGKYLIVGLGHGQVEAMLKRMQAAPPKWLTQLREQLPVERPSTVVYLNLKGIMGIALPLVGPKTPELAKALGLGNVTSLASVVGLDQKACVTKTLLSIDGEPEGLLRLVNVEPLKKADLAIVPQDAAFALAFKLNLEATFDTVLDVAGRLNPRLKEQMLQTIARQEQRDGLKMREDLLKPLGDTWCLFDSPSEGGLLTGLTLVVSLKDQAHAAQAYDKLLALWQSHLPTGNQNAPQLKKTQFDGRDIYTFYPPSRKSMVSPSWCMTDKHLIVSLFPQSIKAYLSRTDQFKSLAQSPEVAQTFEGESGPLKLAYCDTQRVFDVLYPAALAAARAMDRQWRRAGFDLDIAFLPSAGAIRRHLIPSVVSVRRTAAGIEVIGRSTLPMPLAAPAASMASFVALPVTRHARLVAPRQTQSMNNLKQIALAMHNYAQANLTFPPAYTVDKQGKPLLSWRVLILPYIEQNNLYKEFHLDEPWDSDHNKKLIARMPAVYRSPASRLSPTQGKTNYLTVRGEDTIFPGKTGVGFQKIIDGTSNTIMTVEVADADAVEWTKPDDFAFDAKNPTKGLAIRSGRFLAGLCDGSVRTFPATIKPQTLKNLFLCNDRQPIDWNELRD